MFLHNYDGVNIGQRIRHEREAMGLTRADLARLAGIKYPTLAGIENGDQGSTTRLHAIAHALSVSISWLETGKGQKEPPGQVSQSQSVRIDADTIADAQEALAAIAQVQGVAAGDLLGWVNEPYRLALAIEAVLTVKAGGGTGQSNIIDLMAKIAARMRSGVADAVESSGNGTGNSPAEGATGKGKY